MPLSLRSSARPRGVRPARASSIECCSQSSLLRARLPSPLRNQYSVLDSPVAARRPRMTPRESRDPVRTVLRERPCGSHMPLPRPRTLGRSRQGRREPGVGPYTAHVYVAAIVALQVTTTDGNIRAQRSTNLEGRRTRAGPTWAGAHMPQWAGDRLRRRRGTEAGHRCCELWLPMRLFARRHGFAGGSSRRWRVRHRISKSNYGAVWDMTAWDSHSPRDGEGGQA